MQKVLDKITPWLLKTRDLIVPIFQKLLNFTKTHKKLLLKSVICLLLSAIFIAKFGNLFLPPKLAYSYPMAGGSDIPLDTQIELVFDRNVRKSSVEKAFQITPNITGKLTWQGDNRLVFQPEGNFTRGTSYGISLNKLFFSKFFIPGKKIDLQFATLGDPRVILSSPQFELPDNLSPITVVFDRPMVPLTTATNSAEKLPPFMISPKVVGSGRWLGTTSYQFTPDKPYKKASTYSVNFVPDLKSQDGGILPQDFDWTFSSVRPQVESQSPISGYSNASPTASISALLSQNILVSSTTNSFKIFDGPIEIPGRITVSGRRIGFYPQKPLARGVTYTAILKAGLQSTEGPNGLENDFSWFFTIGPLPKVEQVSYLDDYYNQIKVYFNVPMSDKSLSGITISPKPESDYSFDLYYGEKSASAYVSLLPETTYTVTVPKSVTDQYGVSIQTAFTHKFTTPKKPTSISVFPNNTYFAAFNQAVTQRVIAQVFGAPRVDYSLHKLSRDAFMDLYGRRHGNICSGNNQGCSDWQNYDFAQNPKVYSWSESITDIPKVPYRMFTKVTNPDGSNLSSGFYYLDMRLPDGKHDGLVLIVTQNVLTLKKSSNQVLVWAVNQSTGEVIPDMDLEVLNYQGNSFAKGKTNQDGVWLTDITKMPDRELFVLGQKDSDTTIINENWNDGINRYDFGLPYYSAGYTYSGSTNTPHQLFIHPDRPIYRPNQKIYFQGLVRQDTDGSYLLVPPDSQVTVKINDSRGRNLYSQSLPVNGFGSFSGELQLGKDTDLGQYSLIAEYQGNNYSQPFQVEEYRKPEVSVSVTTSKSDYVQGDTMSATINASYYFGAPVSNRPVNWVIKTQDYSFSWSNNWRYTFGSPDGYWSMPWWDYGGDYYYSGNVITSGKGTTDIDGNLKISLPLNISKYDASQKMVLEAVVNDLSNQSIAASNVFTVHKAEIMTGLSPDKYGGNAGEEQSVSLVTVDISGKEIPKSSVNLSFIRRQWDSVRVQDPETGNFIYKSTKIDTVVSNQSITTDDKGYATAKFTPDKGGTYLVIAKVIDRLGNVGETGTYMWISGSEYSSPRENNDRIKIIPSKSQYEVGETASLFIDTPFATQSAKTLLTMERGKVLDYQVVTTSETSNNFSFNIKDTYSPNLYLSAVMVKPGNKLQIPPEFKMGLTQISVVNPKNQLQIAITPDKTRYQPGDTMTVNLLTLDGKNQPVPAELSLGIVDQAVWDLSTSSFSDIHSVFYQPRALNVETSQLLTISLDRVNANTNLGSKGGSGGGGEDGGFDTSRKNFPDTAYWNPRVTTGPDGKAKISFKLPDNLTTWRIVATANTTTSAFGADFAKSLVTRDVLIRPFLPRFLSVGDKSTLGTIVTNTTTQSQTVKASIAAPNLQISKSKNLEKIIPANSSAKFTWDTVMQATDSATVKFALTTSSGLTDSAQYTLPVVTYYTPETVAVSGDANPTSKENIKLPSDIIPNLGGLSLNLATRLGNPKLGILNYLENYAYFCAEQTSSKLLPYVYYHAVLGQKLELADHINSLIQRLISLQKPDGSWGWWQEGEANPYLTAIAYQALYYQSQHSAKNITAVDPKVLDKAREFLFRNLSQSSVSVDYNTKAFILYVLRDTKSRISPFASTLYPYSSQMSLTGKIHLAIASKELSGFANRYQKLKSEIEALAIKTATTVHWEDRTAGYYYGSDIATTATALELFALDNYRHPYVNQILRYLDTSTRDNHYQTTRENSVVIIALATLNEKSGTKTGDQIYKLMQSGNLLSEDTFSGTKDINIPMNQLKNGDNPFEISKAKSGNLYYNFNLKYFLPYRESEAFDQGIVVVRDFLDANGKVISSTKIRENSEVKIRLTVVTPAIRRNVVLEDFLPAGLEAINPNLRTSSSDNTNNYYGYFYHTEYHDDRVSTFAEYLPAGIYEFTYRARSTTPGTYHHPAATAYEMYTPDISGHSSAGYLTIIPK